MPVHQFNIMSVYHVRHLQHGVGVHIIIYIVNVSMIPNHAAKYNNFYFTRKVNPHEDTRMSKKSNQVKNFL